MSTKSNNPPKASVHAIGCRLNQYEGTILEGKLREAGYCVVPFGEEAQLGVINSCTVTNEADAKSRNAIRRFAKRNPNAITVVAGCYSQTSANEVAMVEGVDYVIGNHDKINLLDYLSDEKPEIPVVIRERIDREDFSIGFVGDTQFEQRANLKIQDGCDFMCSFCVIPFARGRARSRDWSDLFSEVENMIEKGVKEIILTGVNIGTYQSNDNDFISLIENLGKLPGLERLRISSIEPTTIPRELFKLMADNQHCLTPYLHVPMQSGCDKILSLMRRKYQLEEMREFFLQAIEDIPQVCIGTDLMTGFPGETQEDFEKTCSTFLSFPFSYCHVFTYSERSGTKAAKSDIQVPMAERRKRSAHLRKLSASKRMKWHQAHCGLKLRVLLETPKNGFYGAYSDHYLRVMIPDSRVGLANRFAEVKIEEARPEYCVGKILYYDE